MITGVASIAAMFAQPTASAAVERAVRLPAKRVSLTPSVVAASARMVCAKTSMGTGTACVAPSVVPAPAITSAVAKRAARRESASARHPSMGTCHAGCDEDCCGGRCQKGLQSPDDGADGICCRFAGVDCQFSSECCSRSCECRQGKWLVCAVSRSARRVWLTTSVVAAPARTGCAVSLAARRVSLTPSVVAAPARMVCAVSLLGKACAVDNQCCSGSCTDGMCCQPTGAQCFSDLECCNGTCNFDLNCKFVCN